MTSDEAASYAGMGLGLDLVAADIDDIVDSKHRTRRSLVDGRYSATFVDEMTTSGSQAV